MNITLQYFEGCPNWERADAAIRKVLDDLGVEPQVEYQLIDPPEAAERPQFRGSPTILLDGVDPFAQPDTPVGMSCRVYRTQAGLADHHPKRNCARRSRPGRKASDLCTA